MRIGVITFFDNGNYGSELQALAMQGFCESRGHEVTFLRIYPGNKYIRFINRVVNKIIVWYKCKTDKEFLKVHEDLRSNVGRQANISPELRNHIQASVTRLIHSGHISAFRMRHFPPYDCYICGSDQVWSALIQPVWTYNFLKGVPADRKIAYAPSVGVNDMPEYYLRTIAPLVKDFKYLSVREHNVADVFEKRFGVKPLVAIDPTILVGRDYWINLLQKENIKKENSPYVFCYFLGEISDEQVVFLNRFADGRKIIILPYEKHAEKLRNGQYVLADHLEFVNYIRYADYVFTDSFHATVFSILFHRDFAVFQRSHVGVTKQTSRIESLLSLVHLEDHLVNNPNTVDTFGVTNYKKVDEIIEEECQKSMEFLDNALTHIQNKLR